MALNNQSVTEAVKRKAKRAQGKVQAAEAHLATANRELKEALPEHDLGKIADAAERTVTAEEEVREAAHELEVVNELLDPGAPAPRQGGASGEGVHSLLPWLRQDKSSA